MSKVTRLHCQRSLNPRRRYHLTRHRVIPIIASVKARWSFSAKFGHKQDALKLVSEFVNEVSSQCSSLTNAQISHGAIGVPESIIELEIEFENLAGIDALWNSIPSEFQIQWTEQMKSFIVDGSAQWTVHHILPTSTPQIPILDQSMSKIITPNDNQEAVKLGEAFLEEMKTNKKTETSTQKRVMQDWKGDLLEINPGDNLPFNFT
eukprot:g1791.t1